MVTALGLQDGGARRRRRVMSSASSPIRILTVDDHPVVREGIAGLVGSSAGYDSGRRSRQRSRCDPAIPHASSGRDADGHSDAGDEWPRRAHRHSNGVPGCKSDRADDLRGRCAHSPRPEGRCSGLPAQEHAPFGITAHDPGSPCWKEESVARGLVPSRRSM